VINPVLRGWVNYFAVGHSSECFSFVKDWVVNATTPIIRPIAAGAAAPRQPHRIRDKTLTRN
jgi:hypothetical protein